MNIKYVSRDLEWNESMKESVRLKICEPLRKILNHSDFELSVHFGTAHSRTARARLEMWVVLQTFDGRHNEVIRHEGLDFSALVNGVSAGMRSRLQSSRASVRREGFFPRFFRASPFRIFSFDRSA